jgi:HK97 family phage major capsid protein
MAITAATKLADFPAGILTREVSEAIFEKAAKASLVQSLARKVPLGASGKAIPTVTGKLQAGWVAEGAQKPAFAGTLGLKTMDPKKIATIAVVSAEVVRANPAGYMDLIRPQIAEAFALTFDLAALHGTSSPFSTNLDTGSSSSEFAGTHPVMTGIYDSLVGGLSTLVNAGKTPNGFALDVRMEPALMTEKDTAGRPLWLEATYTEAPGPVRSGSLLGRRAVLGEGVYNVAADVMAYLGDWSQVAWGAVGEISYRVSTEATVTINGVLTSLWENNLVAILAEAEYGFLVNDPAAFHRYLSAA